MAREQGRQDLKQDIRKRLEPYASGDDLNGAVYAVLEAVLPHFVRAYERGVMGERSKAGYKALRKIKEEQ